MATGVTWATLPTSSSACMIFFILATGKRDFHPLPVPPPLAPSSLMLRYFGYKSQSLATSEIAITTGVPWIFVGGNEGDDSAL